MQSVTGRANARWPVRGDFETAYVGGFSAVYRCRSEAGDVAVKVVREHAIDARLARAVADSVRPMSAGTLKLSWRDRVWEVLEGESGPLLVSPWLEGRVAPRTPAGRRRRSGGGARSRALDQLHAHELDARIDVSPGNVLFDAAWAPGAMRLWLLPPGGGTSGAVEARLPARLTCARPRHGPGTLSTGAPTCTAWACFCTARSAARGPSKPKAPAALAELHLHAAVPAGRLEPSGRGCPPPSHGQGSRRPVRHRRRAGDGSARCFGPRGPITAVAGRRDGRAARGFRGRPERAGARGAACRPPPLGRGRGPGMA